MPDPTTLGMGALAAYVGKDSLSKLLGPTAEYLGGELQEFAQKRIENVRNIFKNAENKLGDEIEKPGSVPPKVLKTIINEGSYSEDQIAVEYFGGILASSRTKISRDDRGSRIAKTVDNMSAYQLRSHYLIYSTLATLAKAKGYGLATQEERNKLRLFLPESEFISSLDLTDEEQNNNQMISHIFFGLETDNLISNQWAYGTQESITQALGYKTPGPGAVILPSVIGVELFLWGFGCGNEKIDFLFSDDFSSTISSDIPHIIPGACLLSK